MFYNLSQVICNRILCKCNNICHNYLLLLFAY
nr:MAG TPA: hypothetical protein [Herelleviridae sp.]